MKRKTKTLDAVGKTLDIIDALWKLEGGGVSELSEQLGYPKSTVYAHLITLEKKGFVVSNADGYELGLRFLNFGEYVKRSQPLYESGEPVIAELAAETEEMAFCMVEQHGLATAICATAGKRAVGTNVRIGTHTYMHASSSGKAILAHLPESRVEEILDRWGLPEFTENTITDRETLFDQLERYREEGVFFSHEEYRRGIATLASPILKDEEVLGSVTVYGPATRIEDHTSSTDLQRQVRTAANQIEVNISVP